MSPLSLIFLHLAPRLYITRVLVAACLCLVIYPLIWTPSWLFSVLTGIVGLHHILCLTTSLRFFFGWMDLILLCGELYLFTEFVLFEGGIHSDLPEKDLTLIILVWIVWGSLIVLAIFRLAKIVDSRGRALIEPFNMIPRRYPKDRIPPRLNMLIGRSLWRAQFIGETKLVRRLRGLLGLSFLVAILCWVFKNILYDPIAETAMGPVREIHTSADFGPPQDFTQKLDPLIWNVIVPLAVDKSIAQEVILSNPFTVNAIWTEALAGTGNATDCLQTKDPITLPDKFFDGTVFFQFLCPPATVYSNDTYINYLPDLAITVNFTALSGVIASTSGAYAQASMSLSIGMTNSSGTKSIRDILERHPVSLIPGTNIAAPYTLRARQVFANHALAAFGVFQKTRAFVEPEILGFYPDPNPDVDTSLQDAQIATFRLYSVQDWSNVEVVIDRRTNSAFAGLSNVGGLWTALNGIFAFIFGASMLHVIYGGKLLSVFGLAHSFGNSKMRDEALRLYPNIVEEHRELSKRGLLSLVKDHLIDLSFLEKEISYSEQPVKYAGDLESAEKAEALQIPLDQAQLGPTDGHRSES